MDLNAALKTSVPFGKNHGRTFQSLKVNQLRWYAENLEGPAGDAALLVYEDRTKNAPPPVNSKPSKPLTIEAQAQGELKAALESAPQGLF